MRITEIIVIMQGDVSRDDLEDAYPGVMWDHQTVVRQQNNMSTDSTYRQFTKGSI